MQSVESSPILFILVIYALTIYLDRKNLIKTIKIVFGSKKR